MTTGLPSWRWIVAWTAGFGLLTSAHAACPDGDPEVIWYPDVDRDGFGVANGMEVLECEAPGSAWSDVAGDCDDADPAVNPGATEICNDRFPIDDDCDGTADGPEAVGQLTLYEDADGDGAGNPARSISACAPPPGYATSPDDCDDEDGSINPAAGERCNGLDDDCDGDIDEDPDPDLAPTWFPDRDGDGSGDAEAPPTVACEPPAGHVRDDRDCDDDDAGVRPDAEESCAPDAEDRNCDGFAGPQDADGDGFPACEDCDDGDDTRYPGAPDVPYDGLVFDCSRVDDFDADGDGAWPPEHGGRDCDDEDPTIGPDAIDVPEDGIDQDCDGRDSTSDPSISCDGCAQGHGAWWFALLLVPAVIRRGPRSS